MTELILPDHVKKQQEKKKREEAVERGEEIEVGMVVTESQQKEDRFSAVVIYDGFVTKKAAEDFLTTQMAAIRGNRKERRAKAAIEKK